MVITDICFFRTDLLFPSHATSFNNKRKIWDTNDIEDLVSELAIHPNEDIIQKHFINGAVSNIRIQKLLAIELYISKYDFSSANTE